MVGDQSMRIADLLESRVAIPRPLGLPIAWPNIVSIDRMRHTPVFMFYLHKL
ncbi:hypothetical protein ACVXG7_02900 [Enterobacter hormaechei]